MSVQDKINRLLWDRRIFTIPNTVDRPPNMDHVIFRDPTLEDRNFYLFTRDVEELRARSLGVSTEGELMENARQGGYWGTVEEEIEAKSEEHLAFLRSELEAKKKFRARQNIIKIQIEDVMAKQEWVRRKHDEFRLNSAEYMAHEIAAFALLRRVLLDLDGKPILAQDDTFLFFKNHYLSLLYVLVQEMMTEGLFEIIDIREIARSVEWRLIWSLSRENLPSIFGRPIGNLTLNHRLLIYWSRIYDSAFESHEPPESDIINDNERFDDWLAHKDVGAKKKEEGSDHQENGQVLDGHYVEECSCGAKVKNKGRGLGEKTQHANTCLYGTWHQYTALEKQQAAQKIYGRNSGMIRKLIDSEQESVLRKGVVEEQHLRDKRSRELIGLDSKIIKRNR